MTLSKDDVREYYEQVCRRCGFRYRVMRGLDRWPCPLGCEAEPAMQRQTPQQTLKAVRLAVIEE